jgi:hemoglobin
MSEASLFEALGGEPVLRRIIDRFVDRVFEDVMIGFLFRAADRVRIKDKEYEFAARQLGAPIAYTGRPLDQAHRAHRIMGGQFMRRLQILKDTLAEFAVVPAIAEFWISHTLEQRALITHDSKDECTAPAVAIDDSEGKP